MSDPIATSANATITTPLVAHDRRVAQLVDAIWCERFADIPRANEVVAGYEYPWKWRLGRIRMSLDQRISEITLNRLLDSPHVPEAIAVGVIAHEIVHYAQGFGSPLPRQQRHAHTHGAVSRELTRRGLGNHEQILEEWSHEVWPHFRDQALSQSRRERTSAWSPCVLTAKVIY